MAAHNVAAYVAKAIASALDENDLSVEIIVVDDASNDNTAAIVAAIAKDDDRVILLRNVLGAGPAAARNRALSCARGVWVAILDSDDLVLAGRSAALLRLGAETGSEIVADNILRFISEEGKTWPLLPRWHREQVTHIDVADYLARNRVTRGDANLGFLKPMFLRAFIETHGLRYDETLRIGEDFDFCLRCLVSGARLAMTSEAFYLYRVRAGSVSRSMKIQDIRVMLAAHERLCPVFQGDRKTREAARAYRLSLEEGEEYLSFRHALRCRNIRGLIQVGCKPRLWNAILHISIGALKRRFKRP